MVIVHVYHVLKENYGSLQNSFAFCLEVESFLSFFEKEVMSCFWKKIMVLYKMF